MKIPTVFSSLNMSDVFGVLLMFALFAFFSSIKLTPPPAYIVGVDYTPATNGETKQYLSQFVIAASNTFECPVRKRNEKIPRILNPGEVIPEKCMSINNTSTPAYVVGVEYTPATDGRQYVSLFVIDSGGRFYVCPVTRNVLIPRIANPAEFFGRITREGCLPIRR